MLPKKHRLTKNKDFARIAKQGQAISDTELCLKWIKNSLPYSRFGVVVSLKIDKRAVVRNRIKRMLRAIVRENLVQFKQGFDFLILVRPKIKSLDYSQIKHKFLYLAQKKHLIEINTND